MAIFGSLLGVVFCVAVVVFVIASWWVLYTKMGEPGWKCLVPFYGEYVLFKRVWSKKAYWGYMVVSVVFLSTYGYMLFAFAFWLITLGAITLSEIGVVAGVVLMAVSGIAWLVYTFRRNFRIAECFGHGIGYWLGITFLPVVFVPMLALGDSRYVFGDSSYEYR